MGPEMLIESAINHLLEFVIETIKKVTMFEETLTKIKAKLGAWSALIKQMRESNIKLGLPESELGSFTEKMKEGQELMEKCSKVTILKKASHTTKLEKFNESLKDLLETLLLQGVRDVKENQKWLKKIHDVATGIDSKLDGLHSKLEGIEKAITAFAGDSMTRFDNKYVITRPGYNIGLDAPLEDLKNKLLEKDRRLVVLSAPGGFGKTTLAKKLCSDNQIKEKFGSNILFVKVSKTPNLNLIVQELYKDKDKEVPFLRDEEDAVIHLERFLRGFGESPMLLVLDDVWSGSESLIEKFNLEIPEYKVLVTSRSAFPRFGPRYDLELLNADDAMTLFRHYASSEDGNSNNIPDDLVNKVVEHCKKVPLALKLIGSSLRNKPRQIWEREVKKWSKGTSILSCEDELLARLQSSIDVLDKKDAILKECFMDLGSFPEDQEIPVTALIDLWTELYELEENDVIASLFDLTYRSLANFEGTRDEVDEEYANYSKAFITQHDLLRELAIHQSSQDTEQRKRLFVDLTGGNLPNWWNKKNEQPFNARLVSISTDGLFSSEWCDMQLPETEALVLNFHEKNDALPEFVKSVSKLKVLMVGKDGHFPTELRNFQILGSLTDLKRIRLQGIKIPCLCETHMKLENLQKLSMVSCEIFGDIKLSEIFPNLVEINFDDVLGLEKLPDTFCDSVSLKQISITHCHWFSSLPDEIGNLINLEVLRLRNCVNLRRLPDSVCKLSKLTFLDISYCLLIRNLPEHIGELRSLRKFNTEHCFQLLELPPSVSDLKQLKDVVCCKSLKEQWELYLRGSNTELTLVEDLSPGEKHIMQKRGHIRQSIRIALKRKRAALQFLVGK